MTILQEIQKWAKAQPAWQQDAIARIYAQAELSAQDYEDLHALLKTEHGIADHKGRKPGKLAAEQIAGAAPTDQRLPIAKSGLSVIYGENGAGKSGYSRALKKACRARDQCQLMAYLKCKWVASFIRQ